MKRLRRKKMQAEVVELNITAFLNLMVILVPFLLITAVFSRMTVLDLNLPSLEAKSSSNQEIKLQLQLVLKPDILILRDNNLGVFKRIDVDDTYKHWGILRKVLIEIKSRFPDEEAISLLVSSDVDYRTMVATMDRLGSADVLNITDVETVTLFPSISIGTIPSELNDESAALITDAPAEGNLNTDVVQ